MNISEKTYHQLKAKIIANELVGAVSENELCQELSVSRTPLREAIFRLMTEGWIEPSKNKTKMIKPITLSEIRDIFQIRKDIEIMVLNLSWDNQDPQRYRAIRDKIAAGFRDKNQTLLLEADNELHEQLLSDCHNAIVTKTLSFIYDRLRMLRSDKMKNESIIDSSAEHLKICDAIIARDIEQTREAIALHVGNSYNRLFSSFK
ncbi:MAG: GntR family transcriptional regulator [Serratia sp. (in: enterobacteria)]|uniref:GntR family transcriptional regulator n=1 Tax=Serratia sp. (in: enterobacteria) TaxID=616 RepID=UPI003F2E3828